MFPAFKPLRPGLLMFWAKAHRLFVFIVTAFPEGTPLEKAVAMIAILNWTLVQKQIINHQL
jgi:hypothetical protein